MIWEKAKYGKAIQRDTGEGGVILEGEAKKGLSDEVILEERPRYNERLSAVDMGVGVSGRRKGGDDGTWKDEMIDLKSLC